MDGLRYDEDTRNRDPNKSARRKARFKVGWRRAVEGQVYGDALNELTWDNLGYRLGKLFGTASDDLIEQQYDWCVQQQKKAQN